MKNTTLENTIIQINQSKLSRLTGYHDSIVSFASQKKNSSLMTIIMTTNTMTMTAILVLPLLYQNYGIISCSLVILVSAYVQYKTCSLVLTHFTGEEDDFSLIVARIMGQKWKLTFNIAILIFQLSVLLIYYLLACNVIFPILVTCLGNKNYQKDKSKITFNEFSFQYAALIAAFLTLISINIQNIKLIIKLGNIGFVTLLAFLVFIIYTTIDNFSGVNSKIQFDNELNILNGNIIYIAGTSSMSFLVIPSIPAIFRESKDQSKNQRDLKISYMIAILLNIMFGVFGYFGIFKNDVQNGNSANTVMDYYTGVYTIIVCFLFLGKICTGIPIVFYIGCQQFFSLLNKSSETKPPTMFQRQIFNTVILIILAVSGLINLNPTIAISISGAIVGYAIGYLIPVLMHLKCIYGILPWERKLENYEDMIDENTGILKKQYVALHLAQNTKALLVDQDENITGNVETSSKDEGIQQSLCRHEDVVKMSKGLRYTYFAILLLIGLSLVGAQFYQIVQEIRK